MYHVIGTGLTALILYFLSYFFYRQSFYSLHFHKRLWNTILAVSFLFTALAGIFLALQTTYKWNIPIIKPILKWHVEFGTALAFTGILHFIWHFSYFANAYKKERKSRFEGNEIPATSADIGINLFVIGFISSSIQLLFLKEIINISGGYELIAGTFFASWLISSAAGSALAGKSPLSDLRKINLFFCSSPILSLFLILFLSRLFLKPGETPSFLSGILFTLVVLMPFCFISGFAFVKVISFGKKVQNFTPGKSYSIETLGGITAGVSISLLGSGILSTYKAILLIVILGISYTLLEFFTVKPTSKIVFKCISFIICSIVIISSPDVFFRQLVFRGIKVTQSEDTPYGNITKGKYGKENSTYYNQRLLTYNDDVVEREENIHYALLQSDKPESILLISGAIESCIGEINKYPVRKIVFIERDPALIKYRKPEDIQSHTKLVIENDDAYSFIKKTDEKFDAAIILLPSPSSLSLNRYYTFEFFSMVKKKLNPSGVFSCSPGINPDYFNKEAVKFYSSVYWSLKAVFKNVIPVCGNKLYFIASDKELSTSFCRLAMEKKIPNVYVGPDYLSDDLIETKTKEVISLMDKNIRINKTEWPIACFYYQSFNLSKNPGNKIPAVVLLVMLLMLPVLTIHRENMIMYFSAASLAGFEIILLLLLQLIIGNMYQLTGLIIAGLMAGLAVGSGFNTSVKAKKSFRLKAILLIIFYFISGFAVTMILKLNVRIAVILILIFSGFLPAVLTGNIFRDLTLPNNDNYNNSIIYSSDLAGSAMGFLIFSALAVPVIGIRYSIFLLPLLIITGLIFTFSEGRRQN